MQKNSENLKDTEIKIQENFEKEIIKEQRIDNSISTLFNILQVISSIIALILTISLFNQADATIEKLLVAPFLVAAIGFVIFKTAPLLMNFVRRKILKKNSFNEISKHESKQIKKINKFENLGIIIFMIGFLAFWFTILFIGHKYALDTWDEGGNQLFYILFVFWIPGLYALYLTIKLIVNNLKKENYTK